VRGFNIAVAMTRPRGKVLLRSTLDGESDQTPHLASLVDREIEVIGSRDGSVAKGLLALESAAVRVAPLLSARVKLADADADIARAATPQESAHRIFTLVEP